MNYINISGYQFINLSNLDEIQRNLKAFCESLGLKGTILLGNEGINSFLSGSREQIDAYYQKLPEFGYSIIYKESPSTCSPFNKMIVKIKREIVTMGRPEVDVVKSDAPRLSPQEFKQWLDEERPVVILDTRNEYEVRIGKFKNAIDLTIRHFREFPDAIQKLPEEYKSLPIVTYCTGGIRCEKAAPFMMMQGFKNVYQLDGGILKYLEECNNAHYEGECFVFDKRIAVDETLEETPTLQCIACREPVTADEQRSGYYREGHSCPRCYNTLSS